MTASKQLLFISNNAVKIISQKFTKIDKITGEIVKIAQDQLKVISGAV